MKNKNFVPALKAAVFFYVFLFSAHLSPGSASDHANLEEGLPVSIVDAYPTPYMNREIQLSGRYERTDDSKNKYLLQPVFEYGLFRNTQVSLSLPVLLGNADKTGSGDIRLDALYNFNTESVRLPAFAVQGEAEFPSGKDASGVDTTLKLIASGMIYPYSTWLHRLHLNLLWTHNSKSREGERPNIFTAILGFSARIGKDMVGIIDIIRGQERRKGIESTIAEIGIRFQWNPLTVISAGVGYGFGDESPGARLTAGLQRSF